MGEYSTNEGASSCFVCPQNHYCPTITEEPIKCADGTFRFLKRSVLCKKYFNNL